MRPPLSPQVRPGLRALWIAALAVAVGAVAQAAPGAHGPDGEHLDAPGSAVSASGLARLPDGSVNVPKAAQRRMGVRTVLAPESEAPVTFELPGRVVADPNASGRVQAVHGGRIEAGPRGLPIVGQAVRRGDALAWVRHHAEPFEAASQHARLAELRAQRQLAEQRHHRVAGRGQLAGDMAAEEPVGADDEFHRLGPWARIQAAASSSRVPSSAALRHHLMPALRNRKGL